jgi:hypothetical protein
VNACDVVDRQSSRAAGIDETVEAVFETDALDAGGGGRADDGADDGVETGGVAAAGEDADADHGSGHPRESSPNWRS